MMLKLTLLERIRYQLSPEDSKKLETKLATLKIRGEARQVSKVSKSLKRK